MESQEEPMQDPSRFQQHPHPLRSHPANAWPLAYNATALLTSTPNTLGRTQIEPTRGPNARRRQSQGGDLNSSGTNQSGANEVSTPPFPHNLRRRPALFGLLQRYHREDPRSKKEALAMPGEKPRRQGLRKQQIGAPTDLRHLDGLHALLMHQVQNGQSGGPAWINLASNPTRRPARISPTPALRPFQMQRSVPALACPVNLEKPKLRIGAPTAPRHEAGYSSLMPQMLDQRSDLTDMSNLAQRSAPADFSTLARRPQPNSGRNRAAAGSEASGRPRALKKHQIGAPMNVRHLQSGASKQTASSNTNPLLIAPGPGHHNQEPSQQDAASRSGAGARRLRQASLGGAVPASRRR